MKMDIRSSYTTHAIANDTFSVELVDEEGFAWDCIDFPSGGNGEKIRTPKGYANSVEGAKAYCSCTWRELLVK